MSSPRQKICEAIGAEGCYFLCIVWVAEHLLKERVDVVELYEAATYTNVMGEDCFVNDPAKLMKMMVPGDWVMAKYGVSYEPKEDEYEITRYERKVTGADLAHFVVTDGAGGVVYDPLGESLCVKLGRPVSKRVFRRQG